MSLQCSTADFLFTDTTELLSGNLCTEHVTTTCVTVNMSLKRRVSSQRGRSLEVCQIMPSVNINCTSILKWLAAMPTAAIPRESHISALRKLISQVVCPCYLNIICHLGQSSDSEPALQLLLCPKSTACHACLL